GDFYFSPALATPVQRGQRVRWGFSYLNSYSHSATDTTGMAYFDSGYRAPNTVFLKTFIAAGTYPYKCKDLSHVPMTGTIKVPVGALPASGALGTTFTITWASATAPAGFVYDVQIKFPGATSFTAWRTGVTYKSTTFTPGRRGDFFFRARLRRTRTGKASGYSKAKKISVTFKRLAQGMAEPNVPPNVPLSHNTLIPNPNAQTDNQRVPGVNGYAISDDPPKYSVATVVMVNVGWHQLQDATHHGKSIKSPNIVDRVLADIRAMNDLHPDLHMSAILRVFAGVRVPDHIRDISPGPILVKDSFNGNENQIGPFWVPEFASAYADLQHGLAALYDEEPLLTGNVMSMATMYYPEPYIRDLGTPGDPADQMPDGKTTGERLRDAGYTDEDNDVALDAMFRAHLVWTRTPSICAFNPYHRFDPSTGGSAGFDGAKTNADMDSMRSILGARAVLANYSVRRNNQAPPDGPVGGPVPYGEYTSNYQHIVDLGQPIMYQTARKPRLCQNPGDPSGDCWDDPKDSGGVLDWCTSYGPDASTAGNAICVELIAEWATDYPSSGMKTFDDRMKARTY
ncbi:MAG: hypothetical protein HYU54_01770, partial [Actinobacteria bacterium]|nr:hypothetical protein [Actinomycetota bacterium]